MNHYLITFIFGDVRTVRNVIAGSSMAAMLVGIAMMPKSCSPKTIICKPKGAL